LAVKGTEGREIRRSNSAVGSDAHTAEVIKRKEKSEGGGRAEEEEKQVEGEH